MGNKKKKKNDLDQSEIVDFYKKRIDDFDVGLGCIKKKSIIISVIKLALILLVVILLMMEKLSLTIFAAFVGGGVILAIIHESILKRQEKNKILRKINENEIKFLNYQFPMSDFGSELNNSNHNYTWDLDIFIERGLFHFLNRATTILGKKKVAEFLKAPIAADCGELYKIQETVKELAGKVDFRQEIQSLGMRIEDTSKTLDSLNNLFSDSFYLLKRGIVILFIHLFPILTLAALASCIIFNLSWWVLIGCVSVQLLVNMMTGESISRIYMNTSRNFKILKSYSNIISEIEKQSFNSEKLNRLQKELFLEDKPASYHIKKLAVILEWFDVRLSPMIHFVLNNMLLWDFQCIFKIEKWRRKTKSEISRWMDVLGYVEALSTLGNLYFNHSHWTMPEFSTDFHFEAASMGHPLIPENEVVRNDVRLHKKGDTLIVTGPNMAGKSTFLRTVGVNIVLAFAGAPVCAKYFKLSPLKLYSSMKISDSLDKGLSLFYAELLRLKKIMDGVLNKEPVFFIIDEMLKGTNALDRRKGSIVLIKQFILKRVNGIVATHDLELAELESAYPGDIINLHFDSYVESDKLFFSYKLKPGYCNSFNALLLMKKIGIKIDQKEV